MLSLSPVTTSPLHGVIVGRLKESHPRWIVVGDHMLFLRAGDECFYKIGTTLQVVYIEQDGRWRASRLSPPHGR
jgi:hypothetical protein